MRAPTLDNVLACIAWQYQKRFQPKRCVDLAGAAEKTEFELHESSNGTAVKQEIQLQQHLLTFELHNSMPVSE